MAMSRSPFPRLRGMSSPPTLRRCSLAALLLAGTLIPAAAQTAPASVALTKSVCAVDDAPPTAGRPSPHGAYITRRSLHAAETGATLEFEVALHMPNFAELQARVARGARISPQDMAARYEPSAANYAQVTVWLTSQGFTLTRQEANHLAVFAQGTVSQVQAAFGVTFARVSNGDAEFTSAITAPSVPASVAPLLVGINGLQPHILLRPHFILHKYSTTDTNPPYLPSQIAQADNASSLYSSGVTGSGQTIAIVIDTFPNTSDLTSFWSTCGVNQSLNNITFIRVIHGHLPSPSGEETLDTEWSSSIAPGAAVRVYAVRSLSFTNVDQAYLQVYDDATGTSSLHLDQMSMSYGLGETYEAGSQLQTDDQYFALLAGAGVTVFASSGDAGATPDSTGHAGDGPLQPESPADDPNVTGVGGTSLTLTSSGSESTEVVWNNSSGATGGGVSAYFSRPAWQTGAGVPAGSTRCIPDVAAPADPDYGALVVLNGSQIEVGGTSWSSPTWAGFCALFNQARANAGLGAVGDLAPVLYSYVGANMRDITSGNNEFQSTQGYSAGTGYDLCTGLGVPNVQGLATALASTSSAPVFTDGPATATGETGSAYSFTYTAYGAPAPTFALAGGSQLPSGVTLSSTGTLSGTPTQSGVFTGTVTASNGVSPNATQAYSLTIDQAPAITNGPPTGTTTFNTVYSFTYTATGYPAPTFTLAAGSLPPGLTLSSGGAITGTTTQSGAFSGTVDAGNGVSPDALQGFTIQVDQAPAFTNTPLSATISTVDDLNFSLTASGYPAPTFTLTTGSLPPGVTLSSSGAITGTPSQSGTFTGTITANNGTGTPATQNFSITVLVATDTPVLPPGGIALLAILLALAGSRLRAADPAQRGQP